MHARTLVVYVALTILFISNSFSQQTGVLKGKVTSAQNNDGLVNAAVRLVNNPSKGTVTDIDGVYFIVLDTGIQRLSCDYVGLQPDTFVVHISADAITEKNVSLQSSSG